MAKAALRAEMIRRRDALSPQERQRLSEAACDALMGSDPFRQARVIMLYAAIRGEASTWPLAAGALAAGKRLVLPRVQRRPPALILHAWSGAPDELERSKFGIAEPRPGAPQVAPGEIDLIVVPGVAFDLGGVRLGHGGGYYDRTLPILRAANPKLLAVGLCYHFQVAERLPLEPHDQRVDAVATEIGLHWAKGVFHP